MKVSSFVHNLVQHYGLYITINDQTFCILDTTDHNYITQTKIPKLGEIKSMLIHNNFDKNSETWYNNNIQALHAFFTTMGRNSVEMFNLGKLWYRTLRQTLQAVLIPKENPDNKNITLLKIFEDFVPLLPKHSEYDFDSIDEIHIRDRLRAKYTEIRTTPINMHVVSKITIRPTRQEQVLCNRIRTQEQRVLDIGLRAIEYPELQYTIQNEIVELWNTLFKYYFCKWAADSVQFISETKQNKCDDLVCDVPINTPPIKKLPLINKFSDDVLCWFISNNPPELEHRDKIILVISHLMSRQFQYVTKKTDLGHRYISYPKHEKNQFQKLVPIYESSSKSRRTKHLLPNKLNWFMTDIDMSDVFSKIPWENMTHGDFKIKLVARTPTMIYFSPHDSTMIDAKSDSYRFDINLDSLVSARPTKIEDGQYYITDFMFNTNWNLENFLTTFDSDDAIIDIENGKFEFSSSNPVLRTDRFSSADFSIKPKPPQLTKIHQDILKREEAPETYKYTSGKNPFRNTVATTHQHSTKEINAMTKKTLMLYLWYIKQNGILIWGKKEQQEFDSLVRACGFDQTICYPCAYAAMERTLTDVTPKNDWERLSICLYNTVDRAGDLKSEMSQKIPNIPKVWLTQFSDFTFPNLLRAVQVEPLENFNINIKNTAQWNIPEILKVGFDMTLKEFLESKYWTGAWGWEFFNELSRFTKTTIILFLDNMTTMAFGIGQYGTIYSFYVKTLHDIPISFHTYGPSDKTKYQDNIAFSAAPLQTKSTLICKIKTGNWFSIKDMTPESIPTIGFWAYDKTAMESVGVISDVITKYQLANLKKPIKQTFNSYSQRFSDISKIEYGSIDKDKNFK